MWSEGPFPATLRCQRAASPGSRLSVRLVMKMSVILCNVMWGTVALLQLRQERSSRGDKVSAEKYTTPAFYNVVSSACT